jgi:predicted phage terminase large subunit-like protein
VTSPSPAEPTGETSPDELLALLDGLTNDEVADLVQGLSPAVAASLLDLFGRPPTRDHGPETPLALARQLDPGFRVRPHLAHLSRSLHQAVTDVEQGLNRRLIIEMPPRSGKTTMTTLFTPSWILRRHPSWPIALTSHDGSLATTWGRQIRRWVEGGQLGDLRIAADAGAVGAWETTDGGKLLSISIRESFTGRGAKVLVIDDPHKDFVDAHSPLIRSNIWDWWLSVAQTRLEPPYLVVVVMTRWHEDDLIGRLLSKDYEGDPSTWDVLRIPALAEEDDPLGREPGEPLISPLLDETREEALARWAEVRSSVGSYIFAGMYQQRPAPAKGSIFDTSWWRYWTSDPDKATGDGRIVHLEPGSLTGARWLDSWDMAFKADTASAGSSWVVGQRWVRSGPRRFLVAQQRQHWTFTQSIAAMRRWARTTDPLASPYGHLVHQRLVEDKANGPAIMDTLKEEIAGIKAVQATVGKESRARAVSPEIESGHVYLPHPTDPGHEWVADLLSELRNFPNDVADDQVDALTQALAELREAGRGSISVPGTVTPLNLRRTTSTAALARTDHTRRWG